MFNYLIDMNTEQKIDWIFKLLRKQEMDKELERLSNSAMESDPPHDWVDEKEGEIRSRYPEQQ